MKTIIIFLVLTFSALNASHGQNYYHYGDIDSKLNKRAILEIAKQEIRKLVLERKIPKSWKSVSPTKIEKNHHTNSNNWVAIFKNTHIKKVKKQTLHIFIDPYGEIKGANYSGQWTK